MARVSVVQPDVMIVLDNDGVITDATLANEISGEAVSGWLGRPWFETVGGVNSDRVRRMIEDARTIGLSAFGQITQRFPSGRELPIEYAAARLTSRAGLVAIGKNVQAVAELKSQLIAAQQAREQEHWKLREIETRYRLLFDTANEAVLLVNAGSLSVADLNLAASRELGLARDGDLRAEVAPDERESLQAMLQRVREHGRAPGIVVHIGPAGGAWTLRASLLTAEPGSAFLLQLAPVDGPIRADGDALRIADLIERLPDGFVVLDRDGRVQRANGAFLDLAQAGVEAAVIGERLDRWVVTPGLESALRANVRRHGAVRLFLATMQNDYGSETAIEMAAVGDRDNDPRCFAVLIRDVTRRLPRDRESHFASALRAISREQLGTASLPSIVRDAVATVERHYVTEALAHAGGNRSAAAALLGVSRQSLYAKLGRYRIDDADFDSD